MTVHNPKTIEEAIRYLGNPHTHILAGGTDLVVRMKEGTVSPKTLINIKKLPLDFIKEDENLIKIGSLTSLETIYRSDIVRNYAPVLKDAVGKMASPQIRNLATIGGNIANASPAGDTIPPLFTLNADIVLRGKNGEHSISVGKFFTGPSETVMKQDELITEVIFKKMQKGEFWFFKKLGQRKALTISKITIAFRGKSREGKLKDVSIALGAVAPTVVYAKKTAKFLDSKILNDFIIDEASEIIQEEVKPITDIRSEAEYRRKMTGALLKQGLIICIRQDLQD